MFRAEIKTYFLPTLVWNCQATQDQLNHVSMCDTPHSDSEHRHIYYDMVLYVLFPRCLRHREHVFSRMKTRSGSGNIYTSIPIISWTVIIKMSMKCESLLIT